MQQDFANLLESLKENPEQGADLGKGLHKVRMAISSKGKGKVVVQGSLLLQP